jgi:toxin YoeB
MRIVSFEAASFKDYVEWSVLNKLIFNKINDLIKEIQRDPFKGIGKPEPLKGNKKGSWSRRINSEHRLVYTLSENSIIIIACHGHYE